MSASNLRRSSRISTLVPLSSLVLNSKKSSSHIYCFKMPPIRYFVHSDIHIICYLFEGCSDVFRTHFLEEILDIIQGEIFRQSMHARLKESHEVWTNRCINKHFLVKFRIVVLIEYNNLNHFWEES